MWRGYKACISSQLPKLSSFELERRFKLAMESISKMSEGEHVFKKPSQVSSSSSSGSAQSSSSSSRASSQSIQSDHEETTQIPETQFDLEGKKSKHKKKILM